MTINEQIVELQAKQYEEKLFNIIKIALKRDDNFKVINNKETNIITITYNKGEEIPAVWFELCNNRQFIPWDTLGRHKMFGHWEVVLEEV